MYLKKITLILLCLLPIIANAAPFISIKPTLTKVQLYPNIRVDNAFAFAIRNNTNKPVTINKLSLDNIAADIFSASLSKDPNCTQGTILPPFESCKAHVSLTAKSTIDKGPLSLDVFSYDGYKHERGTTAIEVIPILTGKPVIKGKVSTPLPKYTVIGSNYPVVFNYQNTSTFPATGVSSDINVPLGSISHLENFCQLGIAPLSSCGISFDYQPKTPSSSPINLSSHLFYRDEDKQAVINLSTETIPSDIVVEANTAVAKNVETGISALATVIFTNRSKVAITDVQVDEPYLIESEKKLGSEYTEISNSCTSRKSLAPEESCEIKGEIWSADNDGRKTLVTSMTYRTREKETKMVTTSADIYPANIVFQGQKFNVYNKIGTSEFLPFPFHHDEKTYNVEFPHSFKNSTGILVTKDQINFSYDFNIDFKVKFDPSGTWCGNGMSIFMHNDPRGHKAIGDCGSGLAVHGIHNGVALLFDDNIVNKPIQLVKTDNFSQILCYPGGDALNDGAEHDIHLNWYANDNRLDIMIDGKYQFFYSFYPTEIFKSHYAYVGVGASTGIETSEHWASMQIQH